MNIFNFKNYKTMRNHFILSTLLIFPVSNSFSQKTEIAIPLVDFSAWGEVSKDLSHFMLTSRIDRNNIRYDQYNMKTGKLDTTYYLKPSKDSTIFYHTYPYNGTFSAMIVDDKDESIWITDSLPGQKR